MSTQSQSQSHRGRGRGGGGGGGGRRGGRRGGGSSSSSSGGGSSSSSSSSSVHERQYATGFIDTHVHVEYIQDKLRCSTAALRSRVSTFTPNCHGMISVFCDPAAFSSLGSWRELLDENDNIWGAFGMHPHNAKYYNDAAESRIIDCLQHPKAVAWGECGLDFHYNHSPQDVQKQVFARQIQAAVALAKPIVVHSRKAEQETIDILREHMPADWRVHIHCFNDSEFMARTILETFPNAYIGFTGALTKSASLKAIVRDVIPLNRLLLETDGPYMVPAGCHGSVSHPGMCIVIAETIAELKGLSVDEVLVQIRANTTAMYGI